MIGIILMTALNFLLYMGMVEGIDNALNVAVFIMWILAIASILVMFISDEQLRSSPEKHVIYRWFLLMFTFGTIFYSIYWGYFWAPGMIFLGTSILWIRKHALDNRKRF